METNSFNVTYYDKILLVQRCKDANDEIFYKITFPDQETIDIHLTDLTDGLFFHWAEGEGDDTVRAQEIGELILAYEM